MPIAKRQKTNVISLYFCIQIKPLDNGHSLNEYFEGLLDVFLNPYAINLGSSVPLARFY